MARRATLCGLGYTVVRAKLHGGGRVCHPGEDRSRPMLAECLMGNTLPGPDLDSGIVKEDGPVKPMTGICPTQPQLTQCCCLSGPGPTQGRASMHVRPRTSPLALGFPHLSVCLLKNSSQTTRCCTHCTPHLPGICHSALNLNTKFTSTRGLGKSEWNGCCVILRSHRCAQETLWN